MPANSLGEQPGVSSFSKSAVMHDTVIGLLINKVGFGIDIHAKVQV